MEAAECTGGMEMRGEREEEMAGGKVGEEVKRVKRGGEGRMDEGGERSCRKGL